MNTPPTVGIGVLTRFRKDQVEQVLDSIRDHTSCSYDLAIFIDRDPETWDHLFHKFFMPNSRVSRPGYTRAHDVTLIRDPNVPGSAHGRNQILNHLQDHDIIFIFEDDFIPVQDGWEVPYIQYLQDERLSPCLLSLNEAHGHVTDIVKAPYSTDEIRGIDLCRRVIYRPMVTMQLMAIRGSLLKTLGYFNEQYGVRYGYDDCDWAHRGRNAGLFGSRRGFPCLEDQRCFANIDAPSSDHKTPEERQQDIAANNLIFSQLHTRPTFLPYPGGCPDS